MTPYNKVQIYFSKRAINKKSIVSSMPNILYSSLKMSPIALQTHIMVTKSNFPNNSIHDPKSPSHYSIKDSEYSLTKLNESIKRYNNFIKAWKLHVHFH